MEPSRTMGLDSRLVSCDGTRFVPEAASTFTIARRPTPGRAPGRSDVARAALGHDSLATMIDPVRPSGDAHPERGDCR